MKLRANNCRHVKNLLPLHAGGDLDPRQAGAVDEHLHACLSCFREYRELITMRGRLGVLAEQPLPRGVLDGFTEEVMARVAVREPGPRAGFPGSVAWRRRIPRLAAAAALVLMVGIGARQAGLFDGAGRSAVPTGSDRLASPAAIAEAPRSVPVQRAADGPLWLADATRLAGRLRLNVPSNKLDSPLFDFIPMGQVMPVQGLAGRDVIRPSYGRGLVPESGRVLRPRYPQEQR